MLSRQILEKDEQILLHFGNFSTQKYPVYITLNKIRFFLKPNSHFYPPFNVCHQVQFQKNIRFKEKLKSFHFG